jgi:hypothetical protein
MITRVRGVTAASIRAGSMLQVSGSMSTKTGLAPVRQIEPAVAHPERDQGQEEGVGSGCTADAARHAAE